MDPLNNPKLDDDDVFRVLVTIQREVNILTEMRV